MVKYHRVWIPTFYEHLPNDLWVRAWDKEDLVRECHPGRNHKLYLYDYGGGTFSAIRCWHCKKVWDTRILLTLPEHAKEASERELTINVANESWQHPRETRTEEFPFPGEMI